MPNQYTKFNRMNVIIKLYRITNPVRSITQMAREFNMPRTTARRKLAAMLTASEWRVLTSKTSKFNAYA